MVHENSLTDRKSERERERSERERERKKERGGERECERERERVRKVVKGFETVQSGTFLLVFFSTLRLFLNSSPLLSPAHFTAGSL